MRAPRARGVLDYLASTSSTASSPGGPGLASLLAGHAQGPAALVGVIVALAAVGILLALMLVARLR